MIIKWNFSCSRYELTEENAMYGSASDEFTLIKKYFSFTWAKSKFMYDFRRLPGSTDLTLVKIEKENYIDNNGYHINKIEKGVFGETSKIYEEIEEFKDALEQGSQIMALVELSDLIGAISGYLEKHYPNIKLDDLIKFSFITQRAFKNGFRN